MTPKGTALTVEQVAACIGRMQEAPFDLRNLTLVALKTGVAPEVAADIAAQLFAHAREIGNVIERSDAKWEWHWGKRGRCPLTPLRLEWLLTLTRQSPQPWMSMPRKRGSGAAVVTTNRTWNPMVAAGWLTAAYGLHHQAGPTWWFAITAEGRKQIPSILVQTSTVTNNSDLARNSDLPNAEASDQADARSADKDTDTDTDERD